MGKARNINDDAITDRERILLHVVAGLSCTQTLGPREKWGSENYRTGADSTDAYVHFAKWDDPKKGDLVLAETGNISAWKIGFYVEPHFDGAVIREIGTGRLCNYRNERFVPIRGLSKYQLYEGAEYQLYQRVLKAFAKGDEYMYRFGGMDVSGTSLTIWVREVFGGHGSESVPFSITMEWNKRTGVSTILRAMRGGGYGTRSFRPAKEQAHA